jgi:uncharacterized protein YwqG
VTELPRIDDLRPLAHDLMGPDDGERIVDLARPAIRFTHPTTSPAGASRLGGSPVLEGQTAWPSWRDRPLSFLGLIDLGAVDASGTDLPLTSTGLLNIFYDIDEQPWGFDPEHAGGWRLVEARPDRAAVSEAPDGITTFPETLIEAHPILTIPDWDEETLRDLPHERADGLLTLGERWDEVSGTGDYSMHQLGGWPDLVQGPIQLECQLASNGIYMGDGTWRGNSTAEQLVRSADDWLLFLQIGSDRALDWMWGDEGLLYFALRNEDIRRRVFDRTWMVLQCA